VANQFQIKIEARKTSHSSFVILHLTPDVCFDHFAKPQYHWGITTTNMKAQQDTSPALASFSCRQAGPVVTAKESIVQQIETH
jgi:hypothetical protein